MPLLISNQYFHLIENICFFYQNLIENMIVKLFQNLPKKGNKELIHHIFPSLPTKQETLYWF